MELQIGRGMLAAMVLGADGVQIGSRFAATVESSAHKNFKQVIIDLKDGDTQVTLKELSRSFGKKSLLPSRFRVIPTKPNNRTNQGINGQTRAKKGMFEGDLDNGELEIGQIAGIINKIKPAGQVLKDIVKEYNITKSSL